MNLNSRNKVDRVALIGLFLMADGSIFLFFIKKPISGLWINPFLAYLPAWVLIWGATVGGIFFTTRGIFQWSLLWLFMLALTAAAGAVSLLWGVPYPLHDPWIHIGLIKFGILDPLRNPYPIYHVLLLVLSQVTGISATHWVTVSGLIAAMLGVTSLVVLARRLKIPKKRAQLAALTISPALYMGFLSRPFNLAFATLPLQFWLIYQLLISDRPQRLLQAILGGFIILSPLLHPQLTVYILIQVVGFGTIVLLSRSGFIKKASAERATEFNGLVVLAGVTLISHLIIYTNSANFVLLDIYNILIPNGGTGAISKTTYGESPFQIFTSFRALQEAILRISYHLIIGLGLLIGIYLKMSNRDISGTFLASILGAGVITGGSILLYLLTPRFGLERVLEIGLLASVPAALIAFARHPKTLSTGLAILAVTAALLTLYPTGFIGASGKNANQQQAAGAEWIVKHPPDSAIMPTRSTKWLLFAYAKRDAVNELILKTETTPNPPSKWLSMRDAYYAFDKPEKSRIHQYVIEGGDSSIIDKSHRLERMREKVYTSGDMSLYKHSNIHVQL